MDRRALDSKLGEGTETGCEGEKFDAGADRDLAPRLNGVELMMAEPLGLDTEDVMQTYRIVPYRVVGSIGRTGAQDKGTGDDGGCPRCKDATNDISR